MDAFFLRVVGTVEVEGLEAEGLLGVSVVGWCVRW